VSIILQFTPWRPFYARKDPETIKSWLRAIGDASKAAFIGGMGSYPPASSPGAWPNVRSGSLLSTISVEVTADEMTIGSNMFYSAYLRSGTSKMARRKMSDDALKEGMAASEGVLARWVHWSYL
jgi:hypothetical protein